MAVQPSSRQLADFGGLRFVTKYNLDKSGRIFSPAIKQNNPPLGWIVFVCGDGGNRTRV